MLLVTVVMLGTALSAPVFVLVSVPLAVPGVTSIGVVVSTPEYASSMTMVTLFELLLELHV